MSSTCSVLPRDLVSVEVAAEQVGARPQTLLTRARSRCFNRCLHAKGAPDGKSTPNAET